MNWKPGLLLRTFKLQEVEGAKIKMGDLRCFQKMD